ncbi:MAG: 50S ribosomal protein L18 [Planctomycetia bacterium]|nr:50S ribosomal protein L18 [Planctomycetia bacterium]
MEQSKINTKQRQRRAWRVSNRIKKNSTRPRMSVNRSLKNISVQIIDDKTGTTLAYASSQDKELSQTLKYGGNVAAAKVVGEAIARRALEKGVTAVTLDRRHYKYHGRVAALADAAREAGLDLGGKTEEVPQE